jgi:hypothetical protein
MRSSKKRLNPTNDPRASHNMVPHSYFSAHKKKKKLVVTNERYLNQSETVKSAQCISG